MSRRANAQQPSTPSSSSTSAGAAPLSTLSKTPNKQTALLTLPPSQAGHLSTLRALNPADYITLLNGFSGTMSILWSMRFCLAQVPISNTTPHIANVPILEAGNMWVALAFMPIGLVADFMDGKVARWQGKGEGSALGQELDSLADLVSFGVAPASAAFALGLRSPLDTLILTIFVLCGLTRLARFNVTVASIPRDASGKSQYFEGLPIPTSLTMVAGMMYMLKEGLVLDSIPGGVLMQGTLLEMHPIAGLFLLWGCMMLSRSLRVPKP